MITFKQVQEKFEELWQIERKLPTSFTLSEADYPAFFESLWPERKWSDFEREMLGIDHITRAEAQREAARQGIKGIINYVNCQMVPFFLDSQQASGIWTYGWEYHPNISPNAPEVVEKDIQDLAAEIAAMLRQAKKNPQFINQTSDGRYIYPGIYFGPGSPTMLERTIVTFDRLGNIVTQPILSESADEREKRIAKSFLDRCDAHDAIVCTGRHPYTGEPVPLTPEETKAVFHNAELTTRFLCMAEGLTAQEFREIIHKWPRRIFYREKDER